jgi:hypothetical protein
MLLRSLFASLVALSFSSAFVACSSDGDKKPTVEPQPDAGRPVITNFDCSVNKWANVSDACWSCMCDACKTTLDACNQDCTDILTCSFEKHTLVNVGADLNCEIVATGTECISDEVSLNAATPLVTFDTCLLTTTKKAAGEFRACDTACAIPYSGDVCVRYPPVPPAPPAMN